MVRDNRGVPISREEALALVEDLQEATGRRDISRLMDFYADGAVAISPVFGEVKGRGDHGDVEDDVFDASRCEI